MPKLFFVDYDLRLPEQNYAELWEALRRSGAHRALKSQWALRGEYTAVQLRDHFKAFIDQNDRLLVTEVADWASFNTMVNLNKVA